MANMMSNNAVTETFQNVLNNAGKRGRNTYGNNTGAEQLANNTQHTQLSNEASSTFLCNQASQMISQIAAAGNAQLNNRPPFVNK
jgi:3-dehydroquinate dehydratase